MVILEVTYRNVEKREAVEDLIREKVTKLEQVASDLVSCRVSIERPQQGQRAGKKSGNPFRVRIDMGVAGNELVTTRDAGKGDMHDSTEKVLRDAFAAARRQLKEYMDRKRGEVKVHAAPGITALVSRIFRGEGYGFLTTLDGREIYFHRNSVLHGDFDRLEVGTGVRFTEEEGEKGPQASTVQIIDKPGALLSPAKRAKFGSPHWGVKT